MSTASPDARPPMSRRRKWAYWAIGIFLALLILSVIFGEEESTNEASSTTTTQRAADVPPPTTTVDEAAASREEAEVAEAREDYDAAIAAFVAAGDDGEANRVRGLAASVVLGRARAAYRAGRYKTAERHARTALRKYGRQASGATRIRNQSRTQLRAQAARRAEAAEARRVAAAQRRAEREAAEVAAAAEAAAEAAQSEAPDSSSGSSSGPSSGGRPGCNPATARDGDGDGVVCE